ncbi:MAG: 2-(1,2-epoxy-1,2-dihydrophenyl)acetyl-CoA isomerase PaaG [Pseudomonadota bacterium]
MAASTAFETIIYARSGALATLTLNRPDKLNSFNVQMHEEVRSAIADAKENARCLLITGAGRGFCAGQDLSDRTVSSDGQAPDLGYSVETYYNPLIRSLTSLPMPVICAVNGVAAGAGANIALACDIVLAAKSAKFIQSFANIGLIPDSGGTWILPRLIGQARAMAIALTATPVTAEQAVSWGMIWQAVDDDALMETATGLADKLANGPTTGLAATKKHIREASTRTLNEELDLECATMRALGQSADYKEGVDAFLNKRKPVYTGK